MSPSLRLDWCSQAAARYACEHWHYSGSVPTPPLVKIGIWEDGQFVGVILFGRGASMHLLAPFGLDATEGAELVRIAMTTHATPVSRCIAVAVRMLKRHAPGLRLLVSFADPNEKHHGGVYQAAGWVYSGTTAPTVVFRDRNGRLWHNRMVKKHGVTRVYGQTRRVLRNDQCIKETRPPKHRYLLGLDADMRALVAARAVPRPKRDEQVVSA